MRAALNSLRWRDPFYYLTWPAHKVSGFCGHKLGLKFPRHAHIIAAQEMLPSEYFDGLFKFAFVRNPWDLQVSSFHHIRRERPDALNGNDDFNEFMKWKFDPERPPQYHIDTSLNLQTDYLVDLHGNLLIDFLGRYENLDEDFARACERIGVRLSLPHRREAKDRERDYRTYYNDYSREMVADHFSQDIARLEYAFE